MVKIPKKCIFCANPRMKKDAKNFIIERTRFCYSMLNIFPCNNGHVMIAPFRHVKNIEQLTDQEVLDLMNLTGRTKILLDKILNPHGYNIGFNIGKAGGAGFENHLHVHIVPRWTGDNNFMPVISSTKVIPQSLDDLHKKLKQLLKKGGSKKGKSAIKTAARKTRS